MKRVFMAILALAMAVNMMAGDFVKVKNGRFIRGGKPYYYVGANFWYGAILGSEGPGSDRVRLCRELDELQRLGIDNLRILVGADGLPGVEDKVEPVLQSRPGVYNDSILAGLDYLLTEMSKRKMVAVLYLTNSWEWSGGYGAYLEWADEGPALIPRRDGYGAYTKFASKFAANQKAHLMFYDHIRFILSRTNRYSGMKYVDDPTLCLGRYVTSLVLSRRKLYQSLRSGFQRLQHSFAVWIRTILSVLEAKVPSVVSVIMVALSVSVLTRTLTTVIFTSGLITGNGQERHI